MMRGWPRLLVTMALSMSGLGCDQDEGSNPFEGNTAAPASASATQGPADDDARDDDDGSMGTTSGTDDGSSAPGDSTGGSDPTPMTTSGSSDDGMDDPPSETDDGADVCAPDPADGDCNMCTKAQCCDELSACDSDMTCSCIIDCVDDGGDPNGCQTTCGNSPLFDGLTGCVIGACLLQCI